MDTSEILFNGEAIGQFVAGPDDEMVIEYIPYRSGVHLEFILALERSEDAESKVQIDVDGNSFIAVEFVKPHFIRVSKGS